MKLKTKLLVSTLFQFFLVVAISGFLIVTSRQISDADTKVARTTEIVDAISQIRFVTFENLLHHDQRSYEQWQSKHASLPALLQTMPVQSPAEKALVQDISQLSTEVEQLFGRLISSYGEPVKLQAELQERLATQLLIKQQTQISDSLKLGRMASEESAALKQRSDVLTAAVIGVMLFITTANFVLIARTVARSLRELQKGAEAIASGKFDYRIIPHRPNDEFGRVSLAFNSMAESVGEIDKAKSEFILLASHQLRTPLTAVKWYAKALILAGETMTLERQKKYTAQVYSSNERMIELVNKLLDATKIGFGNLSAQPQRVHAVAILEQTLKDLSAQIRDNRIELTTDVGTKPVVLTIDPTWMHVIFQNLLSNAIRYSRPGQKVTVSLRQEAGNALFTVADSGYGIPASQQDKIFTKLFRADNAKKAMGEGSGLGLYITKAMVEQAGGKIWFSSAENKGTVFYVTLPIDYKGETHAD